MPVIIAGLVIVGECRVLCRGVSPEPEGGSIAFASPKSSTLTVPSARILMLAGFRSRWMMPCSCAASRASAICLAIGSASSSGIGPCAMRSASVGAVDQLEHQRGHAVGLLETIDRGDVRMVERGEDLRLALEPGEAIGVVRERAGQDFQRDVAVRASCRARDTLRPCRPRRCGRSPRRGQGERQAIGARPVSPENRFRDHRVHALGLIHGLRHAQIRGERAQDVRIVS